MAFRNQQELEAFTEWAKGEIRGMGDHARSSDLFQGEAVGHAVWTLPHKLFLGKVWPKSEKPRAYWVISGSDIPTDHIEAPLAEAPRDAARHFAMKWQLQSARLEDLGGSAQDGETVKDVDWEQVAQRLQAQAEALYGLVEKEDLWTQTEDPLMEPQT
jgi:hypothetical protein